MNYMVGNLPITKHTKPGESVFVQLKPVGCLKFILILLHLQNQVDGRACLKII